ncbi:MAG: (d)CMP kinase [Schleiferiaceae bacterium]
MPNKITIAIDGYSSTGKSTLAKNLAKELSYRYIDTGAMYRCVALYAIENNFIDTEGIQVEKLIEALPEIVISFEYMPEEDKNSAFLNGKNVEDTIRTLEVSSKVSSVAAIPEVRRKMVALQQEMGREKEVVMDGRDIGSVVFPDAELKIFMTADPAIRAQRRFDELKAKSDDVTLEAVAKNLTERDHIDMTREESPLIQVDDARVLDNSHLTREEQFAIAVDWAKEKIGE